MNFSLFFQLGFLLSLIFTSYTYADDLKIFVIKPRVSINWSSPVSLATTSGLNSITNDYAPIGHFAIELNCSATFDNGTSRGVKHVLTGMERIDKKESQRVIMDKKLGLGGMIYPFRGQLVSANTSRKEINLARKQNRLKTIIVPLSQVDCKRGLEFIGKWIQSGSYKIYGGGKDSLYGEGAGCADFMSSIFKIVTGMDHPKHWSVNIDIPSSLVGYGENFQVPFSRVLTRFSWAEKGENSIKYSIADTNKVHSWLETRMRGDIYYYSKHLFPAGYMSSPTMNIIKLLYNRARQLELSKPVEPFRYYYSTTPEERMSVWKSISVHKGFK